MKARDIFTNLSWTDFKALVDAKDLHIQYREISSIYWIISFDGPFELGTSIAKTDPANTDQTDFETNYKDDANKFICTVTQQTTARNEHQLIPIGLFAKEWSASSYCGTIDLSNKSTKTYSYANFSLSGDPQVGDCLSDDSFQTIDFITAVDTQAVTITLDEGNPANGTGVKISRPLFIDVPMDQTWDDTNPWIMFWGVRVHPTNFGKRDFGDCCIVDKDGVGVTLGWYTQSEWNAIAASTGYYEALWYERTYIKFFEKESLFKIPDGSPGYIYKGLYTRIKYYTTDSTAGTIDVIGDLLTTRKDE